MEQKRTASIDIEIPKLQVMENIWVTKAEYIEHYELKLYFNDGTSGVVDLKGNLNQPIFEPLTNIHYFKKFKLNSWTITWENGADFAPEFLYEQAKKHIIQKSI